MANTEALFFRRQRALRHVSDLRPLRAGVIGAGVFGRFHAQKYASMPGVTFVGVADAMGDRAAEAAAAYGVGSFTHIEDLLEQLDAVSIATPATTHAEMGLRCLAAGKHVYVEKPIALDVADATRMIDAAAAKGLVLQTGHQERLVLGATGLQNRTVKPSLVECVRAGPFAGRALDVSVVHDLMIHDIDLAHWLTGAATVSAAAKERGGPGGASDEVEADVTLSSGARATFLASRMAAERKRSLRAVYPDGEVVIDFLARTISNTTKQAVTELFRDGTPTHPDIADPVGGAVRRFVRAILDNTPPLIPPQDARQALDTANRILAAARS
jgi:predicted dehydrogenase